MECGYAFGRSNNNVSSARNGVQSGTSQNTKGIPSFGVPLRGLVKG